MSGLCAHAGIGYDCDADLLLAVSTGPAPRFMFIERDEAALLASADEEHDSVLSWLCLQEQLYPPLQWYPVNQSNTREYPVNQSITREYCSTIATHVSTAF